MHFMFSHTTKIDNIQDIYKYSYIYIYTNVLNVRVQMYLFVISIFATKKNA